MENDTATVEAEHYALDIETTGLDCRSDRVISAAIYSPTATVVMDDRDEVRLLGRLHSTLVELPPGPLVTVPGHRRKPRPSGRGKPVVVVAA